MLFDFATARRILFGPGQRSRLPAAAAALGSRAALITGGNPQRAEPIAAQLNSGGVDTFTLSVEGEPDIKGVEALTRQAGEAQCDLVVAVGGGSAIDAGKAVAALLTNGGELMDYLEVVGRGQPLLAAPAPCIAIPTTAGTGAEVTRNAVLAVPEQRVKVSMRDPRMLPALALVDPELTHTMPPAVTAATGLDALTQLLEAFVSARANPLTDGFCRTGLQCAARSLRRAYHEPDDADSRTDMALAGLLSGLALANAGLGAAHGFAGPAGGLFRAPHGMVCAALLPAVCRANIGALQARDSKHPSLEKYEEAARMLTGRSDATADEGLVWITECCRELEVPGLQTLGIQPDQLPELLENGKRASSMKGNPVTLTDDELLTILEDAL